MARNTKTFAAMLGVFVLAAALLVPAQGWCGNGGGDQVPGARIVIVSQVTGERYVFNNVHGGLTQEMVDRALQGDLTAIMATCLALAKMQAIGQQFDISQMSLAQAIGLTETMEASVCMAAQMAFINALRGN